MQWLPPFDAASAKLVYENATRMTAHRFSPDMTMLFFTETAGQTSTDYAVYLSEPATRYPVTKCSSADANQTSMLVGARAVAGGRGGGGGGGGRGSNCLTGTGPVLLSGGPETGRGSCA